MLSKKNLEKMAASPDAGPSRNSLQSNSLRQAGHAGAKHYV
jgi:hypothetical protein